MKSKYLTLIAAMTIICLYACKKDSKSRPNQIIGKWYESKLNLHLSNGTAVDHDTTFTAGAFTKDDYFQFTSDKKGVFSQSGAYSVTGKSNPNINSLATAGLTHFTWSVADSTLTLNNNDRNTTTEYLAGPTYLVETIVQLDPTHLVLRTTYYPGQPMSSLITTSYFTKGE